jgi:poly-gamma-glutamate synthesis protein (capsule biosynthesis protein)
VLLVAAAVVGAGLVVAVSMAGSPVTVSVAGPSSPTGSAPSAQDTGPGPVVRAEDREHPPRPPAVRTVELAVTGDVILHESVYQVALAGGDGAAGFRDMFAPVADVIRGADLALCHLEVPLSPDGDDLSTYPAFNGPPGVAAALADAGYEGCSVASNHSLDQGPTGVVDTLAVLDSAGLGHVGTARSPAEDAAPRLYEAAGVTVGHVSATYGMNGLVMPADQQWLVDLVDPLDGVLAEAAATRAAGADVVVVSMHWGAEYVTEPTVLQREQAAVLMASPDVDLVIGHHAHVVQPIERHGDKAVVYGLGNFLSGQQGRHTPGTQDGVVVTVDLEVGSGGARVGEIRYTPTWVEPGTYRVLPVPRTLADPGLTVDRREALQASLARTSAAVGPVPVLTP